MELHVWGWGAGLESWAVDRVTAYGRADNMADWREIDEALEQTYRHPSGVDLRIDITGVDTGDQTTAVYEWVARQDQSRVYAMKGKRGYDANSPVSTPTYVPLGRRKRAIRLRSVTGDVFKAELYRFLALPRPTDEEIAENGYPPGYVHVPDYFDAEWCRQLVSERRIRTKTGRFEWKKEHERNEALDCRVGARAVLWTKGVAAWSAQRWASLRERLGLDADPQPERQEPNRGMIPDCTPDDYYADQIAWTRCKWIFAGRGWVDPLKEAKAATERMNNKVSTLADEAGEQGRDWREQIDQDAREQAYQKKVYEDLGLPWPPAQSSGGRSTPQEEEAEANA